MEEKRKLTPKMEKYAQGLFSGLSQRQAYREAYNCENMLDDSIDTNACQLAADTRIVQRLEELQSQVAKRNIVTKERVLEEYAKLGFFNVKSDFLNENGEMKPIQELDEDAAAAIVDIKVDEKGKALVGKLADKKAALDSMAKTLGMFTEKVELDAKIDARLEDFL